MKDRGRFGHFPMFMSCKGRVFLVIGGGKVALRRVHTLRQFDFEIRLVAPEAGEEIDMLSRDGEIDWRRGSFEENDLEGVAFATACTDDRETNRMAGEMCRRHGIPVSVADAPDECDYFFPAVAFGEGVVAGITGDGTDHGKVAGAAERVRTLLNSEDGGNDDGQ